MEVDNKVITIVTVCDNQYSVMLAALLKSLEIHSANVLQTICVYIIDDGISARNLNKLRKSTNESLILKFIPINEVIADRTSLPLDSSSFPLNVYVRLFIPHFLPGNIQKAIYLDVDMITLTDISDLWMTPLKDYIIAAVRDRSGVIGSSWGGITNYEMLGLNPNAPYFNSGLLLIDVEKWRKTNLTMDVLTCISNNKIYATFPDQYGLNVIFADKWLQLDERWNSYATGEIEDPFIIHYIGRKPIFKSYNYNLDYRKKFFEYLQFTAFKNFRILGEHHRLLKKFTNLFVKKFPIILKLKP